MNRDILPGDDWLTRFWLRQGDRVIVVIAMVGGACVGALLGFAMV